MAAADAYVRKYLLRGIPSLFSGAGGGMHALGLLQHVRSCRAACWQPLTSLLRLASPAPIAAPQT